MNFTKLSLRSTWYSNISKGGPIADLNIPGEITNIIKIKKIIHEILLGVQYLKRIGIVHRDLKPANIMENQGKVKIIDFGLSITKSQIEQGDDIFLAGTPGFIAPELFTTTEISKLINTKIDIFSVGIILHFYLFGELVYGNGSINEIMDRNRKGVYFLRSKEEMITDIKSFEAYDLMKKMLDLNQDNRIGVDDALNHVFFGNEGFSC